MGVYLYILTALVNFVVLLSTEQRERRLTKSYQWIFYMFYHLLFVSATAGLPGPPVPDPARPKSYWSWDRIPLAFHGANRTGEFNELEIQILADNYQLVTIEKWYTACGSKHPIQNGPWCDVEKPMYSAFNKIKAKNPNVTTIMYLNSMFNFAMYNLAGLVAKEETAGNRMLLRDVNDELVILCNDGNYYCNVTNFDWTKTAMLDLWLEEVHNATTIGGVDGIFADHATARLASGPDISVGGGDNNLPKLCNGAGSQRKCWYFSQEFADEFNAGHAWLINNTQNLLSTLGGPVVDGPYSKWHVSACDYDTLKTAVDKGKSGTGPYVIEASSGGCNPDDSCIASYLTAAAEYTYLACFSDSPTYNEVPEFRRPLGAPLSDAVEVSPGMWERNFTSGTISRWDSRRNKGEVQWAGQPPPPPSPPAPPPSPPGPVPASCGKVLANTAVGEHDLGSIVVGSVAECCAYCEKDPKCAIWAYHAEETPKQCHKHTAEGEVHAKPGCFAGKVAQ